MLWLRPRSRLTWINIKTMAAYLGIHGHDDFDVDNCMNTSVADMALLDVHQASCRRQALGLLHALCANLTHLPSSCAPPFTISCRGTCTVVLGQLQRVGN